MSLLLICSLLCAPALARDLVVGANSFPPCVEFDGQGRCTGFDVDVLDEVAKRAVFHYRIVRVQHFHEVFDGIRSGRFDLAITGIPITAQREQAVDFSLPYLDSGLRILMRAGAVPNTNRILLTVASKVFQSVRWLLLVTLVVAHVVWLLERSGDDFDTRYHRGILQAIYWAIVTMSTVGYGDYAPKHPVGRVCTIFVIIIGVTVFGFVIAQVTATVTSANLAGVISRPEELKGKLVGVQEETTAVDALSSTGARIRTYASFEEACGGLGRREVEAVVSDSPAVLHRAKQDPSVTSVGDMFAPQKYGIAMRIGSPLRRPIDLAILQLVESERYTYLKMRWFGSAE